MTVPTAWMPAAKMDRIIVHWTAGAHKASDLDRQHYHILVEADGALVRGGPSIKRNQAPAQAGYAAHTLNCNSGSIGVSMCCMAGAVENPFNAGKAPMTRWQWDTMMTVIADLCRFYKIPVTSKTVLSHAEVQGNLGIKQRGKWDIARLAFDPGIKGATAVGDRMRREVIALMSGIKKVPAPVPVPPQPLPPDVEAPERPPAPIDAPAAETLPKKPLTPAQKGAGGVVGAGGAVIAAREAGVPWGWIVGGLIVAGIVGFAAWYFRDDLARLIARFRK